MGGYSGSTEDRAGNIPHPPAHDTVVARHGKKEAVPVGHRSLGYFRGFEIDLTHGHSLNTYKKCTGDRSIVSRIQIYAVVVRVQELLQLR